MNTILKNYTNEERKNFMLNAQKVKKRVEKHDKILYALSENEVVQNGEIVTDNERVEKLQREEFERQFFNTSLGWVKRNVKMQDGTEKSFLTDILPLLIVGVNILTYDTELKQTKVSVTKEFLNECKQQVLKDFYGEK